MKVKLNDHDPSTTVNSILTVCRKKPVNCLFLSPNSGVEWFYSTLLSFKNKTVLNRLE